MPESDDLWQALARGGEVLGTEEDYEHGYQREVRADLRRYLVFRVTGELYALPILELSEIAKPLDTTPVPRTADFVMGIGNVRGIVMPMIDLARRLRLPNSPTTRASRVLIVRKGGEPYGLLVDEVIAVISIAPEELEDAPGALAGVQAGFISALARYREDIVIVLDLEMLLDARDFAPRSTATPPGVVPVAGGRPRP